MSTDTRTPKRVILTAEEREEVWQGLQRIRPAGPDAPPVSLLRPDDRDHALWAVSPAVERIVAARERALREEIAGEIEAHGARWDHSLDWRGGVDEAGDIARGGAR